MMLFPCYLVSFLLFLASHLQVNLFQPLPPSQQIENMSTSPTVSEVMQGKRKATDNEGEKEVSKRVKTDLEHFTTQLRDQPHCRSTDSIKKPSATHVSPQNTRRSTRVSKPVVRWEPEIDDSIPRDVVRCPSCRKEFKNLGMHMARSGCGQQTDNSPAISHSVRGEPRQMTPSPSVGSEDVDSTSGRELLAWDSSPHTVAPVAAGGDETPHVCANCGMKEPDSGARLPSISHLLASTNARASSSWSAETDSELRTTHDAAWVLLDLSNSTGS
ncbi:hypothetical protein F4779DRAFT_587814 [Xylariaceae sp. FL0662B]|nr:hypothetical protein F4779DRAFT_587814 [Xylariaceae sp. FL0662B]